MEWRQTNRHRWEIAEQGFEGRALLQETNSGFIASITVTNTEFDMDLLDEREFFETKQDALRFLEERMAQESY